MSWGGRQIDRQIKKAQEKESEVGGPAGVTALVPGVYGRVDFPIKGRNFADVFVGVGRQDHWCMKSTLYGWPLHFLSPRH